MDLGTMQSKIPTYASLEDLDADLELLVANAKKYNDPTSKSHMVIIFM